MKNKSTKKTKTNKNKKSVQKNWKMLSYLGLSGFLAMSSIGYGVWKSFGVSASANGWTRAISAHSVQVYVCRDTTRIGAHVKSLIISANQKTTYVKGYPGIAYHTVYKLARMERNFEMPFQQDLIKLSVGTGISGVNLVNAVSSQVSFRSIQSCPR